MKKSFLFSIALATSFVSYSGNPIDKISVKKNITIAPEDNGNKFSVGLSVGLSAPLQEYRSTTSSKDTTHTNGYAKAGFHYNISLSYKFSKYVGAMLMVGGNINAVNTDAVAADLLGGGSGLAIPVSGTVKASGPHYVGQYLIGPYLSVPLTSKFFIEVRALVGLMNASYPHLTGTSSSSYSYFGYSASYSASIDRKTNSGLGLGYNFGAGAKYMLGEHLAATLFVDYAGSPMSYKGYSETLSGSFNQIPYSTTTNSTTHLKMSIGMLNVSAGIAYCF